MINMPFQNKMYFISSLPRSGSTLLTSLLNQRPDTYASTTSDLSDSIGLLMDLWEKKSSESIIPPFSSGLTAALNSVLDTRYKNVDAKYIFDKGRHWAHPQAIETIIELTGNIKIIATVRPIAECWQVLSIFHKTIEVLKKYVQIPNFPKLCLCPIPF